MTALGSDGDGGVRGGGHAGEDAGMLMGGEAPDPSKTDALKSPSTVTPQSPDEHRAASNDAASLSTSSLKYSAATATSPSGMASEMSTCTLAGTVAAAMTTWMSFADSSHERGATIVATIMPFSASP